MVGPGVRAVVRYLGSRPTVFQMEAICGVDARPDGVSASLFATPSLPPKESTGVGKEDVDVDVGVWYTCGEPVSNR